MERWKPGFWRIAKAADVPVVPAYFHYRTEGHRHRPAVRADRSYDADVTRIRDWYRTVSRARTTTPDDAHVPLRRLSAA